MLLDTMSAFPIVFIVGPTAVGKSRVGYLLAKDIGAEIISCDSMQVYKEISILSDKPSGDVCKEVQHHLVDIISVKDGFDVCQYVRLALKAIEEVQSKGNIPIIVGGSGLYVQALLDGIFKDVKGDDSVRTRLFDESQKHGVDYLHDKLKEVDPVSAENIHPNNLKRVVRALEVNELKGERFSELKHNRKGLWGTKPILIFGLNCDRSYLYQRVEKRVDQMFESGLVDEIRDLQDVPLSQTAQYLIGIREVQAYLKEECSLEEAKILIKQKTRNYVKRQLTWFRKDKRIQWFDLDDALSIETVVERIKKVVK